MPNSRGNRLAWLAAALLAAAPGVWLFAPVVLGDQSFVYRDAAHFYYPQFAWQREQWAAGDLPLWNSLEEGGAAVSADVTSSVFYPLKLVFALPIGFARCYGLYIALHLAIAGGGAYFLARTWRIAASGAWAAAISYAYGGCVLFNYCNVVFLVGAAWLPLAVWASDRMLRRRRFGYSLALGAALALMTLGGDPQTAFHAGLISCLYAVLLWRRSRTLRPGAERRAKPTVRRGNRLVLLGAAALAAGVLALVQIAPAQKAAGESRRAAFTHPRSIYELPSYFQRDQATLAGAARGLFGRPQAQEHHEHIYHFSVGPWRWLEFIWPNLGGRPFPVNRRWMSAIPAEGRVWSPSLYFGLAPLLAAIGAASLRKGGVRRRWLTICAALSLAAALGWYGVGWLVLEGTAMASGRPPSADSIGPPVGGLYWLFVVAIPGYASFRYPAKILVIGALAASLLAGKGWAPFFAGASRWSRWSPWGVIGATTVGALLMVFLDSPWRNWLAEAPGDNLFGPLDVPGAGAELRRSLAHTFLTASVIAGLQWLARTAARRRGEASAPRAAAAGLVLLAAELFVAHHWLAPSAPDTHWKRPSPLERIVHQPGELHDRRPPRIFRASSAGWTAAGFADRSSSKRQIESLEWDRETLYPRYHLLAGVGALESRGSAADSLYYELFHQARRIGPRRPDGLSEPHRQWLNVLGADYLILPDRFRYPQTKRLAASRGAGLYANDAALPRAWVVEHGVAAPYLKSRDDLPALRNYARQVLVHQGRFRDLQQTVVLDAAASELPTSSQAKIPEGQGAKNRPTSASRPAILYADAQRLELEVTMAAAGWLVIADRYDKDWTAHTTSGAAGPAVERPIVRANGVLRAVWLPRGSHRVTFQYRPNELYASAIISLSAWIALAACLAVRCTRKHRRQIHPSAKPPWRK